MSNAINIWLTRDQLARATWRPSDDLVAKAGVVLDAILTAEIDAPGLANVRADMRWIVERMTGALASDIAPRAKRCLAWRKQRRTWHAKLGLVTAYEHRGEHDYQCVFCGESLDTVSDMRGSPRRIPAETVKRWERHAAECACQVALEIARWNGGTTK